MGSYPYMNPHSLVFIPNNVNADICGQAVFTPTHKSTITGVALVAYNALTGVNANWVHLKLVQLANASNVVAEVNFYAGINLTANTVKELTINSTLKEVAAGTVLAANVSFANYENVGLHGYWAVQVDYVQGAPGSEG